jgi:hypothetical protein
MSTGIGNSSQVDGCEAAREAASTVQEQCLIKHKDLRVNNVLGSWLGQRGNDIWPRPGNAHAEYWESRFQQELGA